MTSSPTPQERAQEAVGTAADEGRHLAGVAQQEAGHVASEAADQARRVMDDAMTQVAAQSKEQKDRLAGTLRTFGDDLESMTSQASPGLAADLTRQVSGYARSVSDHLQSHEAGELLEDVRRFARRRPGTFLLGALAAGVVVGRLARGAADGIAGAKAAQDQAAQDQAAHDQAAQDQAAQGGAAAGTAATGAGGATAPGVVPPTYPGAPSGTPYLPDPREVHDTHGHETGAPTAPATPDVSGGSQGLR